MGKVKGPDGVGNGAIVSVGGGIVVGASLVLVYVMVVSLCFGWFVAVFSARHGRESRKHNISPSE